MARAGCSDKRGNAIFLKQGDFRLVLVPGFQYGPAHGDHNATTIGTARLPLGRIACLRVLR